MSGTSELTGVDAMRSLVTGAAGFIGSQLAEALIERGDEVIGIDRFTEVYPPTVKRRNLETAMRSGRFQLVEADLARDLTLEETFEQVDVVFHLAAIPGVRASWSDFLPYVENNIYGTQRLLEAARAVGVPRVVYASSSSVYGNAPRFPTREDDHKRPHSPYGVSKLAGEHLCETYADAFGVHVVSLRYFTVYGPRQRPDMGIHRLCEAALGRGRFTVFGSGEQIRDMTHVADVVRATILAATAPVSAGSAYNVAGGSSVSLNEIIDHVRELSGADLKVAYGPPAPGDVDRTGGDTTRARQLLSWEPTVDVRSGLASQFAWHEGRTQR